jgi:hypothetical protein
MEGEGGNLTKNRYFNKKTAMLKQFIFILLLALFTVKSNAQSLQNTNWKTFVAGQVNDSIVLHILSDSSFVTMSNGAVVVRSHIRISVDTLSLDDYDGEFACPNMVGKYKFSKTADLLTLTLVDDPCDGRGQSIGNSKWRKVP